jgi:hypothetical protein
VSDGGRSGRDLNRREARSAMAAAKGIAIAGAIVGEGAAATMKGVAVDLHDEPVGRETEVLLGAVLRPVDLRPREAMVEAELQERGAPAALLWLNTARRPHASTIARRRPYTVRSACPIAYTHTHRHTAADTGQTRSDARSHASPRRHRAAQTARPPRGPTARPDARHLDPAYGGLGDERRKLAPLSAAAAAVARGRRCPGVVAPAWWDGGR